uniref:Reverse transcriptase domain-containing protein n=1 Tax=Xenopus tropicalis TaxID=8364 RepID=A0A803JBH2_XENTR
MMDHPIPFLTANVCSIKNKKTRFLAFDFFRKVEAEILFLQETRLTTRSEIFEAKRDWWHGPSFWSIAEEPAGGVGILFKNVQGLEIKKIIEIQVGRCLMLDIVFQGNLIRLINVYGPQGPSERRELLLEIKPYLYTSSPVILAGDFNQVLRAVDRTGRFCKYEGSFMNKLAEDAGLVDVATWGGRAGKHTYFCGQRSSRIDMIFVKKGESFTEVCEKAVEFSDHSVLSFLYGMRNQPKIGRGLWRLDVGSLEGEQAEQSFEDLLLVQISKVELYDSLSVWWDAAKDSFRSLFKSISYKKGREKERRYQSLRKELEVCISEGEGAEKRNRLKQLIRQHQYSRYKSLVLERDYGASVCPDPCQNCKEVVEKKLVEGLYDSQGHFHKSREGILEAVRSYYVGLFRERVLDKGKTEAFLKATPGPNADHLDFSTLEAEITLEEVIQAIDKQQKKKAPGPDGLTAEFYKRFKDRLAPVLVEVFNESLEKGSLPPSMGYSSLILLSKGKDSRHVENWRPIALLNTDRKILARILFSRLSKFAGTLLSSFQYCTVEGRSIFGAVLTIREALERCKVHKWGKYLLTLDQAKAFDKVNHQYLWAALLKYGIPGQFVRWLQTLYQGARSFPLINGWRGKDFEVGAGVRQGCPLSPLLYVFALDPFLRALQHSALEGVRFPLSQPFKLVAYADDVTIVLSRPEEASMVMEHIRSYSEASGSLVNQEKSEAFWVLEEEPGFQLKDFPVAPERIKILGVKFGKGDDAKANWDEKLNACAAKVQRWKAWRLTYRERINVIKSFLVPLLLFVSHIFLLPESFYARVHSLFFQMLWGSRLNPVKRGVTFLQRKEGGLGMLCPVAFFCVIFLKCNLGGMAQGNDSLWESSIRAWVSPFIKDWLLNDRLKSVRIRGGCVPPHVAQALKLIRKWHIGMEELKSAPRKNIYFRILEVFFCVPLALRDCTSETLALSLKFLNSKRLPKKFQDNAWLSLQGKLFVRGNLRYLNVGDRECPWGCGTDETQEHFLLDCVITKSLKSSLANTLHLGFLENLNYTEMAYGIVGRECAGAVTTETLYLIISVMRYYLWHMRCKLTLSQKREAVGQVTGAIVRELAFIKSRETERKAENVALWVNVHFHL